MEYLRASLFYKTFSIDFWGFPSYEFWTSLPPPLLLFINPFLKTIVTWFINIHLNYLIHFNWNVNLYIYIVNFIIK